MKKVVLATGGYDPLHSGHIAYFRQAKELGDILVVGVNSDSWLERKKGKAFLPFEERECIIKNLKVVDSVISFDDSDGSAKDAIRKVLAKYPDAMCLFANGGDRTKQNIPEMEIEDPRLQFLFGIGGENKANSSSWILREWKAPKTQRAWGYYRVLDTPNPNVKVKELTVDPGKRLSMQRHMGRSEVWFVSEGTATVWTLRGRNERVFIGRYPKYSSIKVNVKEWHQLENQGENPLKIIEIQYGVKCEEEDIERVVFEQQSVA
jgi:cytidyltransferase-like protein